MIDLERTFRLWRIKVARKNFHAKEPKNILDARSNAEYLMEEYTPRELTGYMKVLRTNMERIRQEKIVRAKKLVENANEALVNLENVIL